MPGLQNRRVKIIDCDDHQPIFACVRDSPRTDLKDLVINDPKKML